MSRASPGNFDALVSAIVRIHDQSQALAAKAINTSLTARNWLIGHHIVAFEQQGKDRAAYGERLLPALAQRLAAAGLKRVDARELRRFRLFYSVYPQIRETLSPEWLAGPGAEALPAALAAPPEPKRESASPTLIHHLSFSHLAELCDLPDDTQRRYCREQGIPCFQRSVMSAFALSRSALADARSRLSVSLLPHQSGRLPFNWTRIDSLGATISNEQSLRRYTSAQSSLIVWPAICNEASTTAPSGASRCTDNFAVPVGRSSTRNRERLPGSSRSGSGACAVIASSRPPGRSSAPSPTKVKFTPAAVSR